MLAYMDIWNVLHKEQRKGLKVSETVHCSAQTWHLIKKKSNLGWNMEKALKFWNILEAFFTSENRMYILFSYLTIKLFMVIVYVIQLYNKGQNFYNIHNALYPYIIHPFLKIFHMSTVIITVILSIDRYVVVFYPYVIYRNWGNVNILNNLRIETFQTEKGL